MKKTLLLNSALSRIVAEAGHGDLICVADAGLPIPAGPERIDLSVSPGLPSTLQLLNALSSELCVESITPRTNWTLIQVSKRGCCPRSAKAGPTRWRPMPTRCRTSSSNN